MKEGDFKVNFPFNKREQEATRIIEKYPNRFPIICETAKNNDLNLDKHKYLIPRDFTFGQFIYILRKRMEIKPEQGVFIFINNILVPTAGIISNVYREYKDDDGFLYMVVSTENTFG